MRTRSKSVYGIKVLIMAMATWFMAGVSYAASPADGSAKKTETTVAASMDKSAQMCEQIVSADDKMQYDTKELKIDSSCTTFKLTLKHAGKLPVKAMGHNIVFAEDTKVDAVITAGIKAGAAKGYIPDTPDVLAATKLLGGGESDTIEIEVAKFTGKSVSFFCLFPGHSSLMRGKVTVQSAQAKAAS